MDKHQLPPTPQTILPENQENTSDSWGVKTTTVAIIFGAIGFIMVMAAWRNFYADLPLVPPTPMEISKVDEQIVRPPPSPPMSGPNQPKELSAEGTPPPKIESNEDHQPGKSQPNISTTSPSSNNNSSTLTPSPQNPTGTSPAGMTSSLETVPPVSETATPEKNPNSLKIIFAKETWLRITDKEGKKLYDGNARKEVSVTGTPPFNIKLGHSDGVSAEYQGDKIIVKEHPNFNAKKKQLTLGTSSPEG